MIPILSFFLSVSPLFAKPKLVQDFKSASKAARESLLKEKDFAKKSKKLLELEKDFNLTLKEYEKINKTEANEDEAKVIEFFTVLEPAFELAKLKKTNEKQCTLAEHKVLLDDSTGRPEDAPPTALAEEVLAWIKLLCN